MTPASPVFKAPSWAAVVLAGAALWPLQAHALFDDDEARKAILELRQKFDAYRQATDATLNRLTSESRDSGAASQRALLELSNQNEQLRESEKIIWTFYNDALKDYQAQSSATEVMVEKLGQKHEAQQLFATNMRRIRLEKKLTQEKVAEAAGLHPNYIGSVERGERNISICNIERIAVALGVTMSELVADWRHQEG